MEATVRLSVRVKAASQEAAMKLVLEKLPRVLRLSEEVGFRPQWHGVQAKVARVLAPGEVPPMGW
jgi:hypothetical protein